MYGKKHGSHSFLEQLSSLGLLLGLCLGFRTIFDRLGRDYFGVLFDVGAAFGVEQCRLVSPTALAVPINAPLSAYDPRTWTISSLLWWFGDPGFVKATSISIENL